MFNDNMDGTVSLVGSYSKKNQFGRTPPVVVSKRPLDPNEPPMREPVIAGQKKLNKRGGVDVKRVSASADVDGNDVVMADAEIFEQDKRSTTPPVVDPKSSEQMWEYIRPFLSNHKAVPAINWARHIIHLPRIREISWNEERMKEHPYLDSHPRDITALLVQITGIESQIPCDHCLRGRGPFNGCIVISPKASDEVKRAVLSCANCEFSVAKWQVLAG